MKRPFLSIILLPLQFTQWVPIQMGKQPLPMITENKGWKLETAGNAGGFVFLKAEQWGNIKDPKFSWRWKVDVHPKSSGLDPKEKSNDDYALRVGFLFGGGEKIKLPVDFTPSDSKDLPISNVIFYCAAPKSEWSDKCVPNPYHKQVVNCLKPVESDFQKVMANPLKDYAGAENLELLGVWVFADSDNSKSNSVAYLKDLAIHSTAPKK